MVNAKRIMLAAAKAAAIEAASDTINEIKVECDIPRCNGYSVGFICKCGRSICNEHLYFKINSNMKPETICPSCITDNHPELFE